MRHKKHRHQLGVKKEHREALMANLAAALLTHGKIRTTLAKAKALRPFCEKIITLAKKADATEDTAKKLHYRRMAIARVRDKAVIKELFDEKVSEFVSREGGYVRIYKLIPRIGDAADMAIIELIPASDEGYKKSSKKSSSKKKAEKKEEAPVAEVEPAAEPVAEEPEAVEVAADDSTAKS